jgi:alanyl-tRNA synthetase
VKVGSDIEACAGTHVTNTGMIGPIKILHTERIQDGVERIEFAAGEAAVRASQARDDLLTESAGVLRVPTEQLPKSASRFFEEWKDQQKEIERLKEDLARIQLKSLASEAVSMDDGLKVVGQKMSGADIDALIKAATLLAEQDYVVMLGSDTGKVVAAVGKSGLELGVKAGDMIRAGAKVLGGGGGGKAELAQGGGPLSDKTDDAIDEALSLLFELAIKGPGFNRKLAEQKIASKGSKVFDDLVLRLSDKDPEARVEAIKILGVIGDLRAIEPIKKVAQDEKEARVVRGAAKWVLQAYLVK